MMLPWCALSVLLFAVPHTTAGAASDLRLANYYGDHMVLQRAPASAIVWGYEPDCDDVSVSFNKATVKADLMAGDGTCRWKAVLPATEAGGPYTITATSQKHGSATLQDVLFGDVWICSGQSNMHFTVPQAFNASVEIPRANNYPHIRLFTANMNASDTPKEELLEILQPWQVASAAAVNGSGYFSATCWFFGVNIYNSFQVPLGLLATSWGGTRIEVWSSPDAIKKCPMDTDYGEELINVPTTPSVLWNSMMYPFTNMTIYGAIWYQGESNAGYRAEQYACTFPAMINDWREKWYQGTAGQTNPMFPFGFVQLAADLTDNKTIGGFPIVRWAQTANMGYVPNKILQRVFMAVATDLGDPKSPYSSVHIRDKQDVGARLALAAQSVAYNMADVYYSGPIAAKAEVFEYNADAGGVQIEVTFQNTSDPIVLRSKYGFELGCINSKDSQWLEGTIIQTTSDKSINVGFPTCPQSYSMMKIRYDWRTDPCVFKQCAVYSSDLPSPPFVMDITPPPPPPPHYFPSPGKL